MISLSVLYSRIIPVIGMAPNITILRAIQDAGIEYYRTSESWRDFPAPINTVSGTGSYTFAVPVGTRASKIIVAKYGDRPLDPTSSIQRRLVATTDPVSTFQLVGSDSVLLNGFPQAPAEVLTLEVALEPTFEFEELPDDEFQLAYEGLTNGAIARLLSMPRQAWSDPANVGYYQAMFYGKIAEAKSRANADNTAKVRVTTYGGI